MNNEYDLDVYDDFVFNSSVTVACLCFMVATPFFNNLTWFLVAFVCLIISGYKTMKNVFAIGQLDILTTEQIIDCTYEDIDKDKRTLVIPYDKFDKAYDTYGSEEKKQDLTNIKKKSYVNDRIIKGFQDDHACYGGAYFLLDHDQLYFDEDLQAVLTFSSKESAQAWIDTHADKSKDGLTILDFPLALDGKVREHD